MMKRAAEEPSEGGDAQKSARTKGSSGGMKADEVTNPIPRLFKSNSITIHISQRTFEELSPKELKWIPTSQYFAAMFDQFHYNQFMRYFGRCATYTITKPKVRLSNLLMLQDDYVTSSGTPRDVSVFTQACYMMTFTPQGTKNWFKLGCTQDCGRSQDILSYKPLMPTECKLVSQLVKVGEDKYTDFETLCVNPCKPDIYAGWHSTEAEISSKEKPEKQSEVGTESLDEAWDVGKGASKYIWDAYISPRNHYLGMFSCSVKNQDPYIPLMKHTTYMRNLDKIALHKYGETIGFDINTNLEGVPLLNHMFNYPFQGWYDFKTKSAKQYNNKRVQYSFCYPSKNRPFNSRKDNLEIIDTITANKELGQLSHHFLTMPPIKKGDGQLIKQRCSFIMEQSISITFHFPETATEDEYHNLTNQSNGVLLRPAIQAIWEINESEKTPEEPKTPPIVVDEYDKERDDYRKKLQDNHRLKKPTPEDYESGSTSKTVLSDFTQTITNVYKDAASLANFCRTIGLLCPVVLGGVPRKAPPNLDRLKIMPRTPLTREEREELIDFEIGNRDEALFGYLFHGFVLALQANKLTNQPYSAIHQVIREVGNHKTALAENQNIYETLKKMTESYLDVAFSLDQCPAEQVVEIQVQRNPSCKLVEWSRDMYDFDARVLFDFSLQWYLQGTPQYHPMRFDISLWIEYLYKMNILLLPSRPVFLEYVNKYNECVDAEIDECFPRIKKQKIEPITDNQFSNDYVTETFFV